MVWKRLLVVFDENTQPITLVERAIDYELLVVGVDAVRHEVHRLAVRQRVEVRVGNRGANRCQHTDPVTDIRRRMEWNIK